MIENKLYLKSSVFGSGIGIVFGALIGAITGALSVSWNGVLFCATREAGAEAVSALATMAVTSGVDSFWVASRSCTDAASPDPPTHLGASRRVARR